MTKGGKYSKITRCEPKIQAMVTHNRASYYALQEALAKWSGIDFKAGERVYVGNRLHPTPHLPAEPTE